jgi:hypothetical protein
MAKKVNQGALQQMDPKEIRELLVFRVEQVNLD